MPNKKKAKKLKSGIVRQPVAQSVKSLAGYAELLEDLKARIGSAQVRAGLAVNREMILLYWEIGRRIVHSQQKEGWGAKVVARLAKDLRRAFPEVKGFSRANLLYMRAFAEAYSDISTVQQVVGRIPWGHNVRILDCIKDPATRLWYARKTVEHGWRGLLYRPPFLPSSSALLCRH